MGCSLSDVEVPGSDVEGSCFWVVLSFPFTFCVLLGKTTLVVFGKALNHQLGFYFSVENNNVFFFFFFFGFFQRPVVFVF